MEKARQIFEYMENESLWEGESGYLFQEAASSAWESAALLWWHVLV